MRIKLIFKIIFIFFFSIYSFASLYAKNDNSSTEFSSTEFSITAEDSEIDSQQEESQPLKKSKMKIQRIKESEESDKKEEKEMDRGIEEQFKPQASKPRAISIGNVIVRYETHSSPYEQKSYVYGLFAVSHSINKRHISTLYFITKQTTGSYNQDDQLIVGANFLRFNSPSTIIAIGGSSSEHPAPKPFFDPGTTNNFFTSITWIPSKTKDTETRVSLIYASSKKADMNKTFSGRFSYSFPFSNLKAEVYYQYVHSLDFDYKISDIYSASLTKTLSKRAKLSVEWLFVDPVYEAEPGRLEPEDDSIFRLTFAKSY